MNLFLKYYHLLAPMHLELEYRPAGRDRCWLT